MCPTEKKNSNRSDDCKATILKNLCYTELVYGRINKKLGKAYTESEIEDLVHNAIEEVDAGAIERIGKNFYVSNIKRGIRITINSNTCRIITVDKTA